MLRFPRDVGLWLREDGVQHHSKGIVKDFWYDSSEERASHFQARVRVDLNKVEAEILIKHEIVAKHLKCVVQPARVYLAIDGPVRVSHQLPDLRDYMLEDINVHVWVRLLQVLLEVIQTQLVTVLILPVVVGILLHRVIGQVNELVVHVLDVEFLARRADVGIFIEVPFEMTVDASHEAIAAEVKLPSMNQQGVVNVSLNDESLIESVPSCILYSARAIHNDAPDLVEVGAHLNALPTISILPRLYNPYVSMHGIAFTDFLHYRVTVNSLLLLLLPLLAVPLIIRAVIYRPPWRLVL